MNPITNSFDAIISPCAGLSSIIEDRVYVRFTLSRKNSVVTLQWEPFEFSVVESELSFVSVQQNIGQLADHTLIYPYILTVNSRQKLSFMTIDPGVSTPISFYLNETGTGEGINAGDKVLVPGSCISWIITRREDLEKSGMTIQTE